MPKEQLKTTAKEKEPILSRITIADPRTKIYHPSLFADIAGTASYGLYLESKVDFFGDRTWRSIIPEVVGLKKAGINQAVIVGFVTGPGNDGNHTMADRQLWHLANYDSLTHPARPWIKPDNICITISHFEARSDRDATEGEAALAKIMANNYVGQKPKPKYIVTLEDHSHRLHRWLAKGSINHIAVTANQLLAEAIVNKDFGDKNTIVVSPDMGGAGRADDFAYKLARILDVEHDSIDLAIVNKERDYEAVNASIAAGFIREVEDVEGKTVILRDDLGDTLGTGLNPAKKFCEMGAKKIILVETHAVHSTKDGVTAKERIEKAFADGLIDHYFITDSRPLTWELNHPQITVVPVGNLLGEISASILERGYFSTLYHYRDHIFQPKHPMGTVKEIDKKRNGPKNQPKRQIPIFHYGITQ